MIFCAFSIFENPGSAPVKDLSITILRFYFQFLHCWFQCPSEVFVEDSVDDWIERNSQKREFYGDCFDDKWHFFLCYCFDERADDIREPENDVWAYYNDHGPDNSDICSVHWSGRVRSCSGSFSSVVDLLLWPRMTTTTSHIHDACWQRVGAGSRPTGPACWLDKTWGASGLHFNRFCQMWHRRVVGTILIALVIDETTTTFYNDLNNTPITKGQRDDRNYSE